jgi:septum formation protein
MKALVLASGSPTRALLLAAAGVDFEVMPALIDETAVKSACRKKGWCAADIAGKLAEEKALQVAAGLPGRWVLGADQVLDLDGEIIDKCATRSEAATVLARLRGRSHELVIAAAFVSEGTVLRQFLDRCRLTMRDFSDAFLADYLARTGDVALQCVGCYALEGRGVQLFERVEGDFFSVLGLPLIPVLAELRARGLLAS